MKYLMLVGLLFTQPAFAWKLIELQEASVDYKYFTPKGRDPLITGNGLKNKELGNELNLNVNTDFLKYFYFNNLVHSMTDRDATTHTGGQFRVVGLNMVVGVRVAPFLYLYYDHFSKHVLDHHNVNDSFPVKDSFAFKLFLYGKDKKESIF